LGRLFGQTRLNERTENGAWWTERWGRLGTVRLRQLLPRVSAKGELASRHLEEQHPKGVDISPDVCLLGSIEEFWRHMRAGTGDYANAAWPRL
jgi:hypothetical protein